MNVMKQSKGIKELSGNFHLVLEAASIFIACYCVF